MIKPVLKYVSESGAIYIFSVLVCAVGAYLMHQGGREEAELNAALAYVVIGGSLVSFSLIALLTQVCLYVYFDFIDKDKNEQGN